MSGRGDGSEAACATPIIGWSGGVGGVHDEDSPGFIGDLFWPIFPWAAPIRSAVCPSPPKVTVQRSIVAQSWTLPYRRVALCLAKGSSRTLDRSGAVPNTIRRYGRLKICATLQPPSHARPVKSRGCSGAAEQFGRRAGSGAQGASRAFSHRSMVASRTVSSTIGLVT